MPPTFGAPPRCPRCQDRVYAAEQVIGPGSKMYHKSCLKCTVCQRRLDSVTLLEHNGEPFCHNCHRTYLGQGKDQFGRAVPLRPSIDAAMMPRAERRTVSSAASVPPSPALPSSQSTPRMSGWAPSSPAHAPASHAPARAAPAASSPSVPTSAAASSRATPEPAPASSSPSASRVLHTQAPPMLSSTPLCGRCAKPVYFAEQRQAAGRKWHRACLRCDGCRASLDPSRVEDGPSSAPPPNTWCRACYAKEPSDGMPGALDEDDVRKMRRGSSASNLRRSIPGASAIKSAPHGAAYTSADAAVSTSTVGTGLSESEQIAQAATAQRKRPAPPEVLVIVHANPKKKQHHPYNLQVQLVSRRRERSNTGTSTQSNVSSSPSAELASEDTQHQRSASLSSTKSTVSENSDSSASSISRRTMPLYNFDYHHIRTTQVRDAGTEQIVAKYTRRGLELADFGVLEPHDKVQAAPNAALPRSTSSDWAALPADRAAPSDTGDNESVTEPEMAGHRGGPKIFQQMRRLGAHLRPKSHSPTRLAAAAPTDHSTALASDDTGAPSTHIPHLQPCAGAQHHTITTSYAWKIMNLHRQTRSDITTQRGEWQELFEPLNPDARRFASAASSALVHRIWEQFNPAVRRGATVQPPPAHHISVWFEWVREWNGGAGNPANVYNPHDVPPPRAAAPRSPVAATFPAQAVPPSPMSPAADTLASDATVTPGAVAHGDSAPAESESPGKAAASASVFQYTSPYGSADAKELCTMLWTCYLVLDGTTRVPIGRLVPPPDHSLVVSEMLLPSPLPDLQLSGLCTDGKGFTREELRDIVTTTGLFVVVREALGCLHKCASSRRP